MKSRFCLGVLVALLFLGCKKEKPIIFEGQLLFTSKFPYPLGNRKIEIYQSGSSSAIGLSSGSTSSSAITLTAINGNFRLSFIPGTSPDSGYNAATPIFVGKTIDTAIVKVGLSSALTPADTIGLRAYTISGSIDKEYTGRSGNTGAFIVLDSICNMLFTDFNCYLKKISNTV